MKYIDSEKLTAEIERLQQEVRNKWTENPRSSIDDGFLTACSRFLDIITSLQQEQPEVDLEKLGGIARHLIAVKDHEEDMRLDEGEWLLLERIGYSERFNARKEE